MGRSCPVDLRTERELQDGRTVCASVFVVKSKMYMGTESAGE